MKRLTAMFFVLVFVLSLAGAALAATTQMGTIKDIKKGVITFCPANENKNADYKVDEKSVNLSKFKKDQRVKITLSPQNVITNIQPARPVITGC